MRYLREIIEEYLREVDCTCRPAIMPYIIF